MLFSASLSTSSSACNAISFSGLSLFSSTPFSKESSDSSASSLSSSSSPVVNFSTVFASKLRIILYQTNF